MKSLHVRAVAAAVALMATVAVSPSALAAENGLQRYSPGVGGSDMTAPLVPGMYFQMPFVAYNSDKYKGNDGKQGTVKTPLPTNQVGPGGPAATTLVNASATNIAFLPRLTYLSTDQLFGANLGVTVMLPLVKRRAEFSAAGTTVPGVGTIASPSAVKNAIGGQTGGETGIGDMEISPILHWEVSDNQSVTLAPTIVAPTGDYNATQRVNTGYGNYYTFRPSLQYAFIGDGWDVGVRGVLSFNTRNKDTGYLSGKIFNLDYQAMAFVSEDVRLGLQGYFVRQLSGDTCAPDAALPASKCSNLNIIDGNKMSANAAGPAVAWIKNGGEMMLEAKVLREFGVRNRFEGTAFWLTLSKPL